MDLQLKSKIAVVLGASRGIGRAVAEGLAVEGMRVALVARDPARAEAAADAIARTTGAEVIAVTADVGAAVRVELVVGATVERWGSVHVLVHNAGGPPPGGVFDVTARQWDEALQTHLDSLIRFTNGVVPHMSRQGWGRILLITSTAAKEPIPGMLLSNTARAAVTAFAKTIATELAPLGITVNTVCPGGVLTERLRELCETRAAREGVTYETVLAQLQRTIPIGQFATPAELAAMVVFLASEPARYVTGTTVAVDGGLVKSLL
jgi:3-oxoacyl-[acyl-carrier protein] reductase